MSALSCGDSSSCLPRPCRGHVSGPGRHRPSTESPSRERLFSRKYRRPLLLATSIALFNQLSGIDILLFYLLDVLSEAGLGRSLSHTYLYRVPFLFESGNHYARHSMGGQVGLLIFASIGMSLCLLGLAIFIPRHIHAIWYLILLVAASSIK
jgi:hypothetical protein